MIYIANAFSIQMLMADTFNYAEFYPVSVDKVKAQRTLKENTAAPPGAAFSFLF